MPRARDDQTFETSHERALEALRRRNRYRDLTLRAGLDFSSNDYIALAESDELKSAATQAIARGVPLGATGSRLLRGHHREHEALETEAAAFFGSQSALFFSSGYVANYAVFSTLPQSGDLVVHDELIHASVLDGLKAGRADIAKAHHNNAQSFADEINRWRKNGGTGRVWLAVESIYSMDGDLAPVDALFEVANKNDAFLIIDEAHATGVLGNGGRGLAAPLEGAPNVITIHTCGKALGVMGALVCTPTTLRDFLINRARAFIYATAPPPIIAATVRMALQIVKLDPNRRAKLAEHVKLTTRLLEENCKISSSGTHIQPVIIGSDQDALALSKTMQRDGYDIRAIRPPTVPPGTSRLRISVTLNVTPDDISNMVDALANNWKALRR